MSQPPAMQFIEMTGATLLKVINDGELDLDDLEATGVTPETIVRVNHQGDIEIRRTGGWDVVGGLIGEFEHRVREQTGLDWA